MAESVVIVGAKRTPIGSFQGQFASVTASQLGSVAIKAAMAEAGIEGSDVEDAHMGCVLPAGQGQAPARQAVTPKRFMATCRSTAQARVRHPALAF